MQKYRGSCFYTHVDSCLYFCSCIRTDGDSSALPGAKQMVNLPFTSWQLLVWLGQFLGCALTLDSLSELSPFSPIVTLPRCHSDVLGRNKCLSPWITVNHSAFIEIISDFFASIHIFSCDFGAISWWYTNSKVLLWNIRDSKWNSSSCGTLPFLFYQKQGRSHSNRKVHWI